MNQDISQEAFASHTVIEGVDKKGHDKLFNVDRRAGMSFHRSKTGLKGKMSEKELRDSKSKAHFDGLNEAITEMLARRFIAEHIDQIPHSNEEKKKIMAELEERYLLLKKNLPDKEFFVRDLQTGLIFGNQEVGMRESLQRKGVEYQDQVDEFEGVMGRIFREKKDKYGWKTVDDVFLEFTRPYFTGKVLRLARILKEVYPEWSFTEFGDPNGKGKWMT